MNLKKSTFFRGKRLISPRDQRKIFLIAIIQILISALDLFGVIAIGVLGSLVISSKDSPFFGSKYWENIPSIFGLNPIELNAQIIFSSTAALILLIGRTAFSIYFTRRIFAFFSNLGAVTSTSILSKLLAKPLVALQENSIHQTLYFVTRGIEYLTLGVLANSLVMVADIALLLTMSIVLFLVDPTTAVITFFLFALLSLAMFLYMHNRAGKLGHLASQKSIQSNALISEILDSYRENVVHHRRSFYLNRIESSRFELASIMTQFNFMPLVNKYVIESATLVFALVLGGLQAYFIDPTTAVATVAIFLGAGSRMAPALLRVQQGLIQVKGGLGLAGGTLDLLESLHQSPGLDTKIDGLLTNHEGFVPRITANNLLYSYPGQIEPAINGISLEVIPGSVVALVGPSGSGKSTLIDLILGMLIPDSGAVTISSQHPIDAFAVWPGAVSYVPQSVAIIDGSIRENVALGFLESEIDDQLVNQALLSCELLDLVEELPDGLNSKVGEGGSKLSGGQRQRLGIARALYTKPKLLVLDEATSALDSITENTISLAIQKMRGDTTILMAAHRLSTVRQADQVIYIKDGLILHKGTFEEVRRFVPDFENQARLMGL